MTDKKQIEEMADAMCGSHSDYCERDGFPCEQGCRNGYLWAARRMYNAGYRKQVEGDVMEVVRCKDCDVPHNKWTGCPNLNGMIPPPDFYCAKGERKQKPDDVTDINVGDKPPCKVCERITEADKDIFWVFARTHQPEDKEEFRRVPARFCPACGRMIGGEKSRRRG